MDITKMSEEERRDTLLEAKILERLNHPNIIKFREVYKTKKGKLCIVMDQADGGDLSQKITERKGKDQFKENQILDIFVQVCLAMKHIHDRKVLHRDLKSQNIFLTKANMVKLGDFGIAKMLTSTNQMVKTMVGTPYQLSPEIVEGKRQSFKSDLWSMGVLLYEMCTLKPPFDANSLQYLARKIVKGCQAPIPTTQSKELRNLVTMLLNTDSTKRPRVHDILSMPLIKNRIKEFLTTTVMNIEFNHTIIHKKDLQQIHSDADANRDKDRNSLGTNNNESKIKKEESKKDVKKEDDEKRKLEELKRLELEKQSREKELKLKRDEEERKQREFKQKMEEKRIEEEKIRQEKIKKEREDRERREKEKERIIQLKKEEDRRRRERLELHSVRSSQGTPVNNMKRNQSNVNVNVSNYGVQNSNSREFNVKSPRLPSISKVVQGRPLSSRSNQEVRGFSNRPSSRQSNISNNSRDIKPENTGNSQNSSKLKNIDSKLEQLKIERNLKLKELEEKKILREQDRNRRLDQIHSKHSEDSTLSSEMSRRSKDANRDNKENVKIQRVNSKDGSKDKITVEKPRELDSRTDVEKDLESDEEDKPCGIDQANVDKNAQDQMNQEMLNAYLEEEDNNVEPEEDDEEEVEVSNVNIKGKKGTEQTLDKESSFSGDIKQFQEQLIDRVGTKKLDRVRELIKKQASSASSEDEDKFKQEMEKLLDEKQRATYLPMIHALINLEELVKNKKKVK